MGLLLGAIGSIFALIRQGRGIGFPLAGSITGFAGLGIAVMWFTICSGIFTSADRSAKEAAQQMAEENRAEQNALDADRDTAAEKEHKEAENEEARKQREEAAKAEPKAAEEAEAERKRAAEPNPDYIKAQAALRDAQAALREAEAKAAAIPAPQRPAFTPIKGVSLVKNLRSDFVWVYANTSYRGRPRFLVRDGPTADVLDLQGTACYVSITSGQHDGEKGYVGKSNLSPKATAAIKDYLKEFAEFRRAEASRQKAQDAVATARSKVVAAETTLADTPKTLRESIAQAEEEAKRKAKEAEKAEAARRYEEEHRVSRENYNKIKIGMSLREVQNILGPGKENARGEGVLIATWQSEAGFLELPTVITITFINGQVESKAIAP